MKPWILTLATMIACSAEPKSEPRCKMTSLRVSFDNAPVTEVATAVGAAACVKFVISERAISEKITLLSTTELAASDLLVSFIAALSGSNLTLKEEKGLFVIDQEPEVSTSAPSTRPRP
jgi:type II secretory pathway component GspD/PulD (secretin)